MSQPTDEQVTHLLSLAGSAKCRRDKRAAIVVVPLTGRVIGHGTNGPPGVFQCEDVCRDGQTCREKAEHAEAGAIRHAKTGGGGAGGMHIVHVATSTNGQLVTSRPPTEKACASCAVAMVAAGIAEIWLFVEPGEWRRYEMREYYQQAIGHEQLRRSREAAASEAVSEVLLLPEATASLASVVGILARHGLALEEPEVKS